MALSTIARESFILTWPGDEPVEVQWASERILVPGRNEIADTEKKGSRYRFTAALDRAGKPIPGTVALVDDIGPDLVTGGSVKHFDARAYCVGIETNHKALLARGLEIVVDPDDVAATIEKNREKYEEDKEASARQTISEELARRAHWEKQGQPAPRSSSSQAVTEALEFMESRKNVLGRGLHKKEALLAALGATTEAEVVPVKAPVVVEEDEATLVAAALVNQCEEANINLTKPELLGLLKKDTNTMRAVSEKLERATAAA
jgi:hypothetical protein